MICTIPLAQAERTWWNTETRNPEKASEKRGKLHRDQLPAGLGLPLEKVAFVREIGPQNARQIQV